MTEKPTPTSWPPKYVTLKYAGCGHDVTLLNNLHGANHDHCYVCHPELAENPVPGKCPACSVRA